MQEQLKEVRDESIANGDPTTDEHLSRTVLGQKSGYIRGLGPGPKPTTGKSGQTSRAQLIKEVELARQEAASAQRDASEAHKYIEQLAVNMANMQFQINRLMEQQNVSRSTDDTSKYFHLFDPIVNWC